MSLQLDLNSSSSWSAKLQQSPASPVRSKAYHLPKHKLCQSLKGVQVNLDANKIPLIIVACGSYSPITYLHLRMFEMALDYIVDHEEFEIMGGYISPVSDAYAKPGLATWNHRVRMCELATQDSSWIMVDPWEASQSVYIRTAKVLDHFHEELAEGVLLPNGFIC